jgi:N-acetyl-gamma-glutamyl-phosphate reductase
MIQALVFGCTGYTGIELVRIMASHPEIKVVAGSSRQWAGKKAGDVFPFVGKSTDFPIMSLEDLLNNPDGDVAFLALPHGGAASSAKRLLEQGLNVVDLSADCRLHDVETYQQWYGDHPEPDLLKRAVYGLPEVHGEALRSAELVANPGCYPTTVILGLAPFIGLDEVDTSRPIVDSKSGVSGAGRGAKQATSFCEIGEGFKPYGVIGHRHTPEMEQELSELAGSPIKVRFTPHLIPISRGMVSTIYLPLNAEISADALREACRTFYSGKPFVKILPQGTFPDTTLVRGSNLCLMSIEKDDRTGLLIVMTCIDNLVKGASGTAVQNVNLMAGIEETAGLESLPMFP